MKRIIIALGIGIVVGSAATYVLMQSVAPHRSPFMQPKPIQDVPKMLVKEATSHRDDAYTVIQTIEQILSLPTDFAQTEALYTVAGRSNSGAIQTLIYEASQIASESDRRTALQILFSRLTELDPQSALALVQTGNYAKDKQLEQRIWSEWGKNDLYGALFAASELRTNKQRNLAAQALYAAYGYAGNNTISVIEDTLDIQQSRNTKLQYLQLLAAQSPPDAIAYVNSQESIQDQHLLIYWLANELAQQDPDGARQYAELIENRQYRDFYLNSLASASAESNPETVLEDALAQRWDRRQSMQAYSALSQLAARDVDKAISYISQGRNSQERQMFAMVVVQRLAQIDPPRALQWALENEYGNGHGAYTDVLQIISQEDPHQALDLATSIQNVAKRKRALRSLFSSLARTDPQLAVRFLDRIDNREIERAVASRMVQSWARVDPDAAIDWVLAHDTPDRGGLLANIGSTLVHNDVHAAIRLLPRLDNEPATKLRVRIASQLVIQGSFAEAKNFVSQYEKHNDYPKIFQALVRATASSDFQAALQLAHSLQDGSAKDELMANLARDRLRVDPADSVRMLALISDVEQRISATSRLAQSWQRQDEQAASTWVQNLPRGAQRDSAIGGLSSEWDELTPSRKMLLKSVGDIEKRRQAQLAFVHKLARSNPASAERLALEFDITDEYGQHAE